MSFLSSLPSIPFIKIGFNIGAGFDIPTGTYYIGRYGNSVLSGGVYYTFSIVGPPNSFKSVIFDYAMLSLADRISSFKSGVYDSEGSKNYKRLTGLSQRFEHLKHISHGADNNAPEDIKFVITNVTQVFGDEYFELIVDSAEEKKKGKVKLHTAFLTASGKPIEMFPPTCMGVDSISAFKISTIEKNIVDEHNIGSSDTNMIPAREGLAKRQLINRLPPLCEAASLFVLMTAHLGQEFEVGGAMAPKKHRLTFSKKGTKITGAGKAFEFINEAIYEIYGVTIMREYKKGLIYPAIPSDRLDDATDLMLVSLILTRNKNGPTGACIDVVISQREGVLPGLTAFHNIKEEERYGLSGNLQQYVLDLYPDVKLSRTTVRNLIDSDKKLDRALELTYEMLQIKTYFPTLPDDLYCTPAELYADINKLGYDWGILLNTRSYHVLVEDEPLYLPQLTIMDLFRMRKNLYFPYFLEDDKKTLKKSIKSLLTVNVK